MARHISHVIVTRWMHGCMDAAAVNQLQVHGPCWHAACEVGGVMRVPTSQCGTRDPINHLASKVFGFRTEQTRPLGTVRPTQGAGVQRA